MKITFESYKKKYIVETDYEDANSKEIMELFSRLLVAAGFPPSVIQDENEGGSWEWVQEDEEVVKRREECH
jgi:hypothetical protein